MTQALNRDIKAMLATASLTRDQLRGLTRDQLRGLTGDQVIPKVQKLYSNILAGIRDQVRQLDQSTFGPDSDPGKSLCRTPMCIAGHTVNCAGAAGYALADCVGFAAAAALIHGTSRPDVSRPRYDSYPSDWALAYIEARAAEEEPMADQDDGPR